MSNTEQATTPPTAKDWREFVEERSIHGDTVLDAHCFNGQWYGIVRIGGSDGICTTTGLILKPKPKTTRPWTPDEVPVGATVKCNDSGCRFVINASYANYEVGLGGVGTIDRQELHDNYLLELTRPSGSTPGTYGVCGMEE